MKQLIKKLSIVMAALAGVFLLAGCYSDFERVDNRRDAEFVRTNQHGEVRNAHAKMYQTYGAKERLGTIKFHESDAGLSMEVSLAHLRPGVEYDLCVKNAKGEEVEELPSIVGPANGKIDATYIAHNVSAQQLAGNKVVLKRHGEKVGVGKIEKGINLF